MKGESAMKRMSCFLVWILGASIGYADPVAVNLNTSPLFGGQFSLVFDLIDGDATANNSATVNNAQFGGGGLIGSPILTGSAAGSLSGIVTLTDSAFFNEYFHDFSSGSLLSFVLDFTANFAGGTPDSLTFLLIDNSTGFPIPTLAPLGTDVFLAVDLNGSSPVVQTFGTDPARTNFAIAAPDVSSVASVPEPNFAVLIGAGLVGLALVARLRISKDEEL
jgi:hypothetical protein